MPEQPLQSDIFKFVALRPPVPASPDNQELNYIVDTRTAQETPVGRLLAELNHAGAAEAPAHLQSIIINRGYDLNFPQSQGDSRLNDLFQQLFAATKSTFDRDLLVQDIESILDQKISDYLAADNTRVMLNHLWDHYYAFHILSKWLPVNLEQLTQNLKTWHVLNLLQREYPIMRAKDLKDALQAKPLVPAIFSIVPKVETPPQEPPVATGEETINSYKRLWNDWMNAYKALEEVKGIELENKLSTQVKQITVKNSETGVQEKQQLALVKSTLQVNSEQLAALRPETKTLLNTLKISEKNYRADVAFQKVQENFEHLNRRIATMTQPQFFDFIPEEAKSIAGISAILSPGVRDRLVPGVRIEPATSIRSAIKPLGIGDLKIVKQELTGYKAGEIAHIENVLRGEYKERKHRVLDRSEELVTISQESEEETTRDTQTTERFELKKESEKTIQEQMSVQAGVTVSGSYGMVSFSAYGDFAYNSSTQESSRNASNFAREVVDKSVSRIQKKMKEERTSKKLHEVEELNTHGIDNKLNADHAVGIYRWVDKFYKAQIYNYGKRLMMEFVVPEPGLFYEHALAKKAENNISPPVTPYKWGTREIITHHDITEWSYQYYIRDYQVQGVTTPPPFMRIGSLALDQSGIQNGTTASKSSKELIVPEGYAGMYLGLNMSAIWEFYPQFKVSIGEMMIDWLKTNNSRRAAVWGNQGGFPGFGDAGPVPVAINAYDINSYTVSMVLICHRQSWKYEQWQIQTYEKIMAAYQAKLAEYEQKIAAAETRQGIVIQGQNPRINRDIERTELKKHCVKMLMDTWQFGNFQAVNETDPPDFDIFTAFQEGKIIQFFEQAFEWENLTYLFYPYFWGRRESWEHKLQYSDTDPLFTKFMQAGAARVVLPVHPAYNDAFMYFMENNGAIWQGGDTPRLNDPMFISIAEELRDQTDDVANAQPEGEPWEVVLPTSLVYLQKDAELPVLPTV